MDSQDVAENIACNDNEGNSVLSEPKVSNDSGQVTATSVTIDKSGTENRSQDSNVHLSATGSENVDGVFVQPNLPPPASKSRSSGERKSNAPSPFQSPQLQEKLAREKQEKYSAILSTLNYQPPEYAAPRADPRYNLEVLKNGTIVDSVNFIKSDSKGYYVIGRTPGCDIVAENPTVSRLHAILQFVEAPLKEKNERGEDVSDNPQESGLYLYDLKSTHGTFINKNQVFPNRFYRVHVGHVLKFGSSQRMYIVNGPMEDEEEESDKSVTELMNEKLQKDLERKRMEEEEQLRRGVIASGPGSKLPKDNIEEEGIDWGMGEDADEGSDLKINPFSMDYEASELTLDNPKKTLRSWFDREGHDLEYEMREKGNGQYVCRIGLPLDGPTDGPVYAESEVKGKKKEAAYDAAMKACQILDSHGILRGSNQESRKRKEKHYDEDYYSSDEDTFLDRTGSVEKKREKRMRLAGKLEETVETYESLTKKYADLEKEVKELQSKVDKSQQMKTRADDGDIDIDDYMKMLKSDVFDVKKLKSRLKEATEEMQRTKRLMDIAKPAELPSYLQKQTVTPSTSPIVPKQEKAIIDDDTSELQQISNSPVEIKPSPERKPEEIAPEPKPPSTQKVINKGMLGPMKPPPSQSTATTPTQPKLYGLIKRSDIAAAKLLPRRSEQDPPTDLKDTLEEDDEGAGDSSNEEDEQEGKEAPDPSIPKKKKRQRHRNQYRKPQNPSSGSYDYEDPKYTTWVPPKNQTGDGRTSLNEKLGY